jgi:hypothetical protein
MDRNIIAPSGLIQLLKRFGQPAGIEEMMETGLGLAGTGMVPIDDVVRRLTAIAADSIADGIPLGPVIQTLSELRSATPNVLRRYVEDLLLGAIRDRSPLSEMQLAADAFCIADESVADRLIAEFFEAG